MRFRNVRGNVIPKMNKSTTTLQTFLSSYREFSLMEHEPSFHVPQTVILGSSACLLKGNTYLEPRMILLPWQIYFISSGFGLTNKILLTEAK